MATTRLRKTFHYPSDTDDDDALEDGMDAQDQTELVQTLQTHDTASTRLYTHLLLLLPLAPALLYIPRLFSTATFAPSIAALASLLASAYALYYLPLDSGAPGLGTTQTADRPAPPAPPQVARLLETYGVVGNTAVCAVLALLEVARRRTWSEGMAIGGGYVPGLVLVVILWARRELRAVDMAGLERARLVQQGM